MIAIAPSAAAGPLDGCHVAVCFDEWEYAGNCEDDPGFEARSTAIALVAPVVGDLVLGGLQVVAQGYWYCSHVGESYQSANNVNGGVYSVVFVGAGVGTYSYTDADGTEEGTYVSVVHTYGDAYYSIPIAPVHPDPGWGHLLS